LQPVGFVVHPVSTDPTLVEPHVQQGHLAILKGNLSEEGCVAKITGLKHPAITGPARVFDSEEEAKAAILGNRIRAGLGESVGGTIALVHEGDSITIDAELAMRRAAWQPRAPRYTRGVLAKYAKLVSSASQGAVTD
jgi:dihydroxy-acid dehydratase